MNILLAITATDIAAWSGLAVAVIGAIVGGIVKIIGAQADLEKQRTISQNSADIAGLKSAHEGNQNAINNLSAAVTSHDAQLTTVALTTVPELPK